MIGFGAPLDDARLAPDRAERDWSGGEGEQEIFITPRCAFGRWTEERREVLQHAHGVLEGQTEGWHIVLRCGFRHKCANQIVRGGLKEDFLLDHFRDAGAKHVQSQGGFDVSKEQFDLPAAAEKLGQRRFGISGFIEEPGHQGDLLVGRDTWPTTRAPALAAGNLGVATGIINQNLTLGAALIALFVTLSTLGLVSPVGAALLHELSAFIVILNSARLLRVAA